jgi:predicted alternative tryptophan synthase beta-subunit
VDEALQAREEGRPKVILFCLSGHGHFDLGAYEAYLSGQLQN